MVLNMNWELGDKYKSNSQKARVITEQWISDNMFCPRCGNQKIMHLENNRPVADFYCPKCNNQYELKSKDGVNLDKVNDGAYATMIDRIASLDNPDFFFMSYSRKDWVVCNLFLVPKHFFTPSIIEKRPPLSQGARREGWTGCNILLSLIPAAGRIPIIENGSILEEKEILRRVSYAELLRVSDMNARGWLFDVLSCIEKIDNMTFTLPEVYRFENMLSERHPNNHNIRPKIRQQLQFLSKR